MTSVFKKVVSAFAGLAAFGVLFFAANTAVAATTLTAGLQVSDPACATCWGSSVRDIHPGDVVSFMFTFRNDGNEVAQNVSTNLNISVGKSDATASGTTSATNASPAVGTARVTFNTNYTNYAFQYQSAKIYTWDNYGGSANGSSGTVNVGNVKAGEGGYVVMEYKVTGNESCGTCGGGNPTPTTNVRGYHDGAQGQVTLNSTSCVANGWATDPDGPSKVNVTIRATGSDLSQFMTTTSANLPRSDVDQQRVCFGGSNCAFVKDLSSFMKPGMAYTIRVSATDLQTNQEVMLSGTDKVLTCGQATQPPQVCTDRNATNYGGALPCRYDNPPQVCTDPNATNYGGSLPCRYNNPPTCPAQPTAVTGSATNVTQTSATLSATATNASSVWIEYGLNSSSVTRVNLSSNGGSVNVQGLSPNTNYVFRVVAQSSNSACSPANGVFQSFRTDGPPVCTPPTVSLNQAPNVAAGVTSATISGTVNPNGGTVSYYFMYGTDPNNLTIQIGAGSESGSGVRTVYATIPNLQNGQTYYYRLVAQGACGGAQQSQTLNFQVGNPTCVAPYVTLQQAYASQNTATLSGQIDPRGQTVSYYFRYTVNGYTQYTPTQTVSGSGYQSVSYTLNNLQANTTYTYSLVAQTGCANVPSNELSFTTGTNNPTCTAPYVSVQQAYASQNTATLYGQIDPRGQTVSYYFSYTVNGYTQYTQTFTLYGSGSQQVSYTLNNLQSNATYYYRLVAQVSCTTERSNEMSFTTGGGYIPPQQGNPPIVITDPATAIAARSAILNGRVNPQGYNATGWFEWGTTFGLGNTTVQQAVGSQNGFSNLSAALTNLSPNTTYYFRAVGQNAYGTRYGEILSFRTGSGGTVITTEPPIIRTTPPVVVTTGTIGGGSCLILTPTIQPTNPVPGQEFIYGITYRNDCPFDLRNASMRITIPNEVDFGSTNYPFLTRDLNVITYSLGTIPRNFQNTILIRGIVKPTVQPGDNLIFKADLSFADAQNRIQTVSAFLTATVAGLTGAVAGIGTASIFGALLAFLSSGWFWFLLFLLLLALFILWLATRNRHADLEHE